MKIILKIVHRAPNFDRFRSYEVGWKNLMDILTLDIIDVVFRF